MAERYGFFNSVNGDRIYDASDVAGFIKKFFTNGVFNNSLQVSSNDNMTVSVAIGSANIEGYSYELDEEITLDIEEADSILSRIDSVILRLDLTNRQISLMLLTGSYATNPSQPSITRSGKIYDLRLANISIPANSTRITADMISDMRFSSDCGNVTQAVLSLDTDEIFRQYDTTFKNLFEQMKNLLDSDTAGTLQNEINVLSDNINKNTEDEWEVVEILDEELEEYTQKEGYLVNEKNKEIFNGEIPKYEKKVYEKILEADTSSISIPCDILSDGGHYKLVMLGKTTTKTDLHITFNNDSSAVYYQSGINYSGTGTSSDSTLSGATAYRPARQYIYYGINFYSQGIGKLTMDIDFNENEKKPFYKWNMDRTYSGDSLLGFGNGMTGSSVGDNITSIDIATGAGSISAGTKIQLFRD